MPAKGIKDISKASMCDCQSRDNKGVNHVLDLVQLSNRRYLELDNNVYQLE